MKKIAGVVFLVLALALPLPTKAQVNFNINISVPPPIVVSQPPRLVVIPETYVYVAPELDVDIFFYDGWWWRSWDGRWYRSRSYSSGWIYYQYEPVFYRDVPREWRRWHRDRRWREYTWEYRPIPFSEVEKNWRDWEHRRYWERENTWGVRGLRPSSQIRIDVNLSAPPAIMFPREPQLIVIPETYVYVVPNLEIDVFFYDGWWWRTWEGRWYRSRNYTSGWVYYRYVPVFYRDIPRDWRQYYREHRWRENYWDHRPLPYHQVEQNWRDWEGKRYWEKQKKWDLRTNAPKPQKQDHIIRQVPPSQIHYAPGGQGYQDNSRGKQPQYYQGGKTKQSTHPKGNPHKDKEGKGK